MKKSYKKEYIKQRKRIQSAMSRLRKQGFEIPLNILPDIPKKITKSSISRLQKIKPETIRKKSVFINRQTGEVLYWKKKKEQKEIKGLIKKYKEDYERYKNVKYIQLRDIFNDLISRLSQFPPMVRFFDKSGGVYNVDTFDEIVNPLVEIAKNAYANDDRYNDYLETVQDKLFSEIDNIIESKYFNEMQDRYYRVAQLISGNTPLSLSDRMSLNEYQENNEMSD